MRRFAGYAAAALGLVLLAISAAWWAGEASWGRFEALTPEQAFADGSFGLELAPLKYILVAGAVSKAALQIRDDQPWPTRFGFLARKDASTRKCEADAPANLPIGFSVSNRLPGNATPLPVKFVGLTCAACHSAKFGDGASILGVGAETADVIAFSDAFLTAVLDTGPNGKPGLDAAKILVAYDAQCPADTPGILGWGPRSVEAFFIDRWLDGARNAARLNASKYDLPFHGKALGEPRDIPTGPSRTRPFRSVVRNTLDLPGADNRAYSKVPLAAMQRDKKWSQFDGSIGDPVVRSMIAVFTSGASAAALNEPQIADNIEKAATYTLALGVEPKLPTLAESFPTRPLPAAETVARGREIYLQHCDGCHGHPEPTGWKMPPAAAEPSITSCRRSAPTRAG